MTERPPALPDFKNPPLVEAALAIQFEPLPKLRTVHLGLLSQEFAQRYPIIEEHPPAPSAVELFGVRRPRGVEVRFEMADQPPLPALWFFNSAGTELVQVQNDRFGHNWRKIGEGESYPHYERIKRTFEEEIAVFQSFIAFHDLGELVPVSCEVTYIDHIESGPGWERHGEAAEVLAVLRPLESGAFLPEAEEIHFRAQYVIRGSDGEPIGRLHFNVEPAYQVSDDKPILVLTAIARGQPIGKGIEGALAFMDIGREWVVRGFADITTPKMHQIWERTQ